MRIHIFAAAVARSVVIAFRAVRILATDPQLPKALRILFVVGCVQLPFSPVDEVALVIALAWLAIFHRPALARAMREAKASAGSKERKPLSIRGLVTVRRPANVRRFVITIAAALAAVISLGAGLVPASAATDRSSDRSLVAAVVTGATFEIDGVTRAAVPVESAPGAVCARELAAYRLVSRQAGLRIGSTHIREGVLATGPRTWARELRRAGDGPLAATALGIHDRQSDEQFTLALTASAAAALQGSGCRS